MVRSALAVALAAALVIPLTVALCAGCNKGSDGNAPDPSTSSVTPQSSGGEGDHKGGRRGMEGDGGMREHREERH